LEIDVGETAEGQNVRFSSAESENLGHQDSRVGIGWVTISIFNKRAGLEKHCDQRGMEIMDLFGHWGEGRCVSAIGKVYWSTRVKDKHG